MIMQVHDELVLECPPEDAERAAAMVAAIPPDERAALPPTLDITCHMCGRTWTVTTNP